MHTHTHTRLTALFLGLPGWTGTRKVKPLWILLRQETGSGRGISWAICKSAPCSRQTTMPAPHHSVFFRPDALPAAQPTASKHWMQQNSWIIKQNYLVLNWEPPADTNWPVHGVSTHLENSWYFINLATVAVKQLYVCKCNWWRAFKNPFTQYNWFWSNG